MAREKTSRLSPPLKGNQNAAKSQHLTAALRESEEKYRTLIEYSNDLIWMLDKEGRFTYFNKRAEEVSGYRIEDWMGKSFAPLIPPEDLPRIGDIFKETMDGKPRQYEVDVRREDSSIFTLSVNTTPIFSYGKVVGTVSFGKDITLQKKADQELEIFHKHLEMLVEERTAEVAEAHRQLHDITSVLGEGIYVLDEHGCLAFMNPEAERLLGWKGSELLGSHIHNIIHYQKADGIPLSEEECPVHGVLKSGRSYRTEDDVFTRRDGTVFPVEYISTPISKEGRSAGAVVVFSDITKRKQAENKLKLYSQAIEEAMDGIQIVDLAGYIVYSNKAVEEIYGYSANEFIGKHVKELNVDNEFDSSVIIPSIKETGRWSGEIMVYHKDRHQFPIWLSASIVKDKKGKPIAMIGIIRDITERKRAEEKLYDASLYTRSLIEVSPDPLVTISLEGRITDVNKATVFVTGVSREKLIGSDFSDYFTEPEKAREGYQQVFEKRFVKDYSLSIRHISGSITDVLYNASIYKDAAGNVAGVFAAARDITERKKAEEERERLIHELQDALGKVKLLSGMLPICASCKKIRDDKGYWKQLEAYITEHSEALFSHGLCPDCAKKALEELEEWKKMQNSRVRTQDEKA